MNRGDTAIISLNEILVNGEPMVEGAYDEIEVQVNHQSDYNSIKKLLSKGEVIWGTATYYDGQQWQTFTGYYCRINEAESLLLDSKPQVQVRISIGNDTGSIDIDDKYVGPTLSTEIISDGH